MEFFQKYDQWKTTKGKNVSRTNYFKVGIVQDNSIHIPNILLQNTKVQPERMILFSQNRFI